MTPDRALQESVLTELSWEPSIEAAHIGVTVENGLVTLSGHVENLLQKRNAEKATARVRGVKAVVEGLEVRMPFPLKQSDEEIAKAALNRLDSEVDVPKDVVTVTVQNGWVTLTGRAEWHFQRQAAERILRGLVGVVGIQNEMTTKAHAIVADVTAEIDAALHRSRFDPRTITVTADGGRVTLSGTVPNLADRYIACQTAWKSAATTEVENNLVVA